MPWRLRACACGKRAPAQYEQRHLPGAVSFPRERLRVAVEALNHSVSVITYCYKGASGNTAQSSLPGKGFTRAYTSSGGAKQYWAERDSRK